METTRSCSGERRTAPKAYNCSRYLGARLVVRLSVRPADATRSSSPVSGPPGSAHFPSWGSRMRLTSGSHSVMSPVAGLGRSAKMTVDTASETPVSASVSADMGLLTHGVGRRLKVYVTLTQDEA